MSKSQKIFSRKEKKYLLSTVQYQNIMEKLNLHMQQDEHGLHTICSLYYDTNDYELIRTSIEKPIYKEKFRVRSYGVPKNDSQVFVELKKKFSGTVDKKRVELTNNEAQFYLAQNTIPLEEIAENEKYICKEINWFLSRYKISPKALIAYERLAYFGIEDTAFRITFDFNIRSRTTDLFLEHGTEGDLISDKFYCLMEVKALGGFPVWLARILSDEAIYPNSFSKYAQCYQQKILPTLNFATKAKITKFEGERSYVF